MNKIDFIFKKAKLFEKLATKISYADLEQNKHSDSIILTQLINDLNIRGYEVELKSENYVRLWLQSVLPEIVQRRILDTKTIKQCGSISTYICMKAAKQGIVAGVFSSPGHFETCFPLDDGNSIYVDASYLQFGCSHGGLRDFAPDERDSEEYIKMLKLFNKIENDPMYAVKIYKEKGIPTNISAPPEITPFTYSE